MKEKPNCVEHMTLIQVLMYFFISAPFVWANSSELVDKESHKQSFSERAETGLRDPVGWHYYWKDG